MSNENPRQPDQQQYVPPRIRYAPCGELRIYPIPESELDELARGSPAALQLNLAIFFLSVSVSFAVSLLTTVISSIHLFIVFVIIAVTTFIAGVILVLLWARSYRSSKRLTDEIKARMTPEAGIQEPVPEGAKSNAGPSG